MQPLKFRASKNFVFAGIAAVLVIFAVIYFATLPVAEVAIVQRGTAISAVYGTVRIEPSLVIPVRAQNSGFIQLGEALSAGRGAIGRNVEKGELLATIADEATARLLKQARADLQAARERGQLPLPSAEALKVAEDNLGRLEKLSGLSNVPQVEFEKAKSEVKRLRALVETERIERDRNLAALGEAAQKLEAQMKNSEIRSPMDGLLTGIKTIDGELVAERAELFTVSSRKNYVRGEVDEEDVGEVKLGMPAIVQVYAYRTRTFHAKVAAIQPAADIETQRYTIVLDLEDPPENLMAGMTGEMNIITGQHENALLIPTRALLVDQALVVKHGILQSRTVKIGYRTLDFSEALDGVSEGDRVVLSDQDKLRPGRPVRTRISKVTPRVNVQ
ncbi:MAG TPA: efflux RND transporter periplasmic adaptor subunit [Chthoniobacterales bacterium]|nr:efflux RND transporter periplasmic adaptor subunit [Chthoniobacterales bacterium]